MSSVIPITLQPVTVGYSFQAATIDELITLICQHVQGSINQNVSFFDSGATDPSGLSTPLFYNTTQGVFKYWSTLYGKYLATTSVDQAGDFKFTAVGGDDLTRGWAVCDGRLISAVPGITSSQITAAESLFGVGGNLPVLGPILYTGWTQYTKVYIGQP